MPGEHGYPDVEQPQTPHGTTLDAQRFINCPAPPVTADFGPYETSAYRSLALGYQVSSETVSYEAEWEAFGAPTGPFPVTQGDLPIGSDMERISNKGHRLRRLSFSSTGGAGSLDFYLVGSNIDPPFDVFVPPWLTQTQFFFPLWGNSFGHSDQFGGSGDFFVAIFDATYIHGYYLRNLATQTTGQANRGYLIPMQRYVWYVLFWVGAIGTSFGKLTVSLKGPIIPPFEPSDVIEGTQNGGTYYDIITHDFYHTTPRKNAYAPFCSYSRADLSSNATPFRITGPEEDPVDLTAVTIGPGSAYAEGNGSPGYYWLNIRVDGKNAASTGYRIELSQVTLDVGY